MKAIAQSLLLAALLGFAGAHTLAAETDRYSDQRILYCGGMADFARSVMTKRQAGTPMQTQMANVLSLPIGMTTAYGGKNARAAYGEIIEEAYQQVRYMDEKHQRVMAEEFGNRIYSSCLADQ